MTTLRSTITQHPNTAEAATAAERSTYDLLADEYYDAVAHPTCYNLNRLSRLFIERHLPEPWNGRETLEVGAGDSCVASILHARGYSLRGLRITDASEGMLRHSWRWKELGATLMACDAYALSHSAHSISLLVASLGDPYNTPGFWAEAHRGLRPEGELIFTIPSFAWSSRFRGMDSATANLAEFVLRDGRRVVVPSCLMSLPEQVRMIEDAGFMVAAFESLGADSLRPDEPRSPKIDVFGDQVSSLVWGFKLIHQRPFVRP
jgi:hypothetical protein